jgi:hypothetical protein
MVGKISDLIVSPPPVGPDSRLIAFTLPDKLEQNVVNGNGRAISRDKH